MITPEVEKFFGGDSPMQRAKGEGFRYEPRPQQVEMALAVAHALDDGKNLCVEAPTGVGKTFAYLVPALAFARQQQMPVVISTHTINLQEQIITRDIPMLERMLGHDIAAFVAKGRTNYLCLRRYNTFFDTDQALLDLDGRMAEINRLQKWASQTLTGDYSEMRHGVSPQLWHTVCCERGGCLGSKCEFFKKCYLQHAKRKLFNAELIIANHAKFFTTLAMDDEETDEDHKPFPDYAAVILDEGHTLEDCASEHLGFRADTFTIRRCLGRLYHTDRKTGILANPIYATTQATVTECTRLAKMFFQRLLEWLEPQAENPLRYYVPNHIPDYLGEPLRRLTSQLERVVSQESDDTVKAELSSILEDLEEQTEAMRIFFSMELPDYVYWFEREGNNGQEISFNIVPVNVADVLSEKLFSKPPVIVTSATLAVNGNIQYFQKRTGCEDARALILDSPFDYEKQVKVYIAGDMPEPGAKDQFQSQAAEQIRHYLRLTHGRAFVLFTSYYLLSTMAKRLAAFFDEEDIRLLVQGEDLSPRRMLEEFRKDGHAVIFGTASFWTGVDVPGDALSNVIITRLPFAVPNHPLVQARSELIEKNNGNSFMDYSVPEAVLKFRQGFGRLIRTKEDTGIIVILDSRIVTKRYGSQFLNSIPHCPIQITNEGKSLQGGQDGF
ncbi:MAG: DEAD/DEAH box helicase [Victivallales bacterium]|nr:DEAD/DEAH box helicase [Victivallales bacterium]